MLASLASTYEEVVVDQGNQPLLVMLVAFGATFGITRFITHSIRSQRFSWLHDVEAGDTHVHHLVYGILLLLISGVVAIALQPPLEVTAVIFGVGAALTLDEFALWLHLSDVYWSEQGRQSVDAVIVFAIVTGFMVVGGYPLTVGSEGNALDIVEFYALQVAGWGIAVVCFLKGKLIWGVIGIYVWPIGVASAIRLARPGSRWAQSRYGPDKLDRSRGRYAPEERVHKPVGA